MYLSHYHLKVKPFQITPDPQFLWLGESHREALAIFKDGIDANKGLILLTGDVGTGKTTLINKLIESLDDKALVASVQYPGFDILDFYNFLAANFKMGKKYSNKGDFLIQFIHYLHEKTAQDQKVVLIIDEAQGLSDDILDEIRLLSNLERAGVKLLNILLVGQDEMNAILDEPNNKLLKESIAAKYFIGPLKKWEVKEYIQFRLKVAGADYRIFNKGAIEAVVKSSQCFPRLINVICDHALLTGYVQGKNKIDAAIIKECAKEHQLQIIDEDESEDIFTLAANEKIAESTGGKSNYHWALPAVLVMFLSLLVMAGYFSYLKTSEIKDTVSTSSEVTPSLEKGGSNQTQPSPHENDSEIKNEMVPNSHASSSNQINTLITEEDIEQDLDIKNSENRPKGDDKKRIDGFDPDKLIVYFQANAQDLSADAYTRIDVLVAHLLNNPTAKIVIRGYTDSSGDAEQNKRLSQVRADVVRKYITAMGVEESRVEAMGLGDRDPIESNDTASGRRANRRIEIELVHFSNTSTNTHIQIPRNEPA